MPQTWKDIVASALNWEQAHAGLDAALVNFPAELRGSRPNDLPHSVWELLEHIRITQHDLLDFCANENYEEKLEWPKDYWPSSPAPKNDAEWTACVRAIHADGDALSKFTIESDHDLTSKIPHGTGQTYLRTVLVAIDHTSHHLGQIIITRRLLGSWPPAKS